jgi:hypothetical protein
VDGVIDNNAPILSSLQDCVKVDAPSAVQELPDIFQLDIRNSVSTVKSHEEFDFFQDMEPVILKTCILQIDEQEGSSDVTEKSGKHIFNVNYTAYDSEEGWGDDLEEWGDLDEGNVIST